MQNNEIKATLIRLFQDDKQTLSEIHFYQGLKLLLTVKCLELPDRQNQRSISRINPGIYYCYLRYSSKYGWHFEVRDVEGRTFILMHFGNFYYQTEGCLLVGNAFVDINNDGHKDVTSSRKTMKRILNLPGNKFKLNIINEF